MNRTISTTVVIAVLAALVAAPVHADALFHAENKAGGQIFLTDTACSGKVGMNIVYSTGRNGENTIFGCWTYDRPNVMVQWDSGGVSAFPAVMFEVIEQSSATRQPARTY